MDAGGAGGVLFTEQTTVKCSLEEFCKEPPLLSKLRELAAHMARITSETSELTKLWLLKVLSEALVQNTLAVPEEAWTSGRVLQFMYVVTRVASKSASQDWSVSCLHCGNNTMMVCEERCHWKAARA